jgi:hypothetical protein
LLLTESGRDRAAECDIAILQTHCRGNRKPSSPMDLPFGTGVGRIRSRRSRMAADSMRNGASGSLLVRDWMICRIAGHVVGGEQ